MHTDSGKSDLDFNSQEEWWREGLLRGLEDHISAVCKHLVLFIVHKLWLSLERFETLGEASGIRISTSKAEAKALRRRRVYCTLWVGRKVLLQQEEFKYIVVFVTGGGETARETGIRIGEMSAIMQMFDQFFMAKKELKQGEALYLAGQSISSTSSIVRCLESLSKE